MLCYHLFYSTFMSYDYSNELLKIMLMPMCMYYYYAWFSDIVYAIITAL